MYIYTKGGAFLKNSTVRPDISPFAGAAPDKQSLDNLPTSTHRGGRTKGEGKGKGAGGGPEGGGVFSYVGVCARLCKNPCKVCV